MEGAEKVQGYYKSRIMTRSVNCNNLAYNDNNIMWFIISDKSEEGINFRISKHQIVSENNEEHQEHQIHYYFNLYLQISQNFLLSYYQKHFTSF